MQLGFEIHQTGHFQVQGFMKSCAGGWCARSGAGVANAITQGLVRARTPPMKGWPEPEASVSEAPLVPLTSWHVPGAVPSYALWPPAWKFHAVQVDCGHAHRSSPTGIVIRFNSLGHSSFSRPAVWCLGSFATNTLPQSVCFLNHTWLTSV